MTNKYASVSGVLGYQFKLNMMDPQRAKESTKTSDRLIVSLSVAIQEKQYNIKDKCNRNSMVELKKTVIHQRQISGQH